MLHRIGISADHAHIALQSPHINLVIHLIYQGQLDRAREVLALHSSHLLSDDKSPMMKEALNSVDELLRKMPLFSAYVGKSVTEFDLRWQRWREECHLRLAKGERTSRSGLH